MHIYMHITIVVVRDTVHNITHGFLIWACVPNTDILVIHRIKRLYKIKLGQ